MLRIRFRAEDLFTIDDPPVPTNPNIDLPTASPHRFVITTLASTQVACLACRATKTSEFQPDQGAQATGYSEQSSSPLRAVPPARASQPFENDPLMKANKSSFTRFLWVVHKPCGAPL